MLTANLKFVNRKFFCSFLSLQCFIFEIEQLTIPILEAHFAENNHVPINHKQMSFVSNGGKFKLFQMVYFLQRLLSPGFHLNA
jgi:hypothetical protein